MPPNYPSMLRTAGQIQGAIAATWLNLAKRGVEFVLESGADLSRDSLAPFFAAPTERQTACDDALWTAYVAHQQWLRALTGASRLSLLVFVNELDRRRGARSVATKVPRAPW